MVPPPELPHAVAEEAVRRYNAATTTRLVGRSRLPHGNEWRGDVAVRNGTVVVAGRVDGTLLVINGDAILDSGAVVTGDVFVVGGTVARSPGATVGGDVRVYTAPLAYRTKGEDLALAPPDLRRWFRRLGIEKSWGTADSRSSLTLATGGTFNRVEGLPVVVGPLFDWKLHRNVRLRVDALAVFRNSEAWRPNAPIDDGHYTTLAGTLTFDTRNDRLEPTAGWFLRARFENSRSEDVIPQTGVPASVRAPLPTDGSYAFSRLFFDFRRYTRVSPSGRIKLRLFAGGWIGGDPLPLQQRLSTGGPDPLAGYGFRASACNGDIIDPAFRDTHLAACDRVILAQAEYRGHLSLHWSYGSAAPQDESAKFPFTLQGPDLVVLADAGQAWLVGSGPGRLPADRLPTLGSWLADLGLGIDWGGLGLYVAKAVTAGEPLRFTLRLDHRF